MTTWVRKKTARGLVGAARQIVAIVLALLQTCSLITGQNAPPTTLSAAAQRIKSQVSEISVGGKLTVFKADGSEYHGHLQAIEPEIFVISEVDLKQRVTIRYDEVERIRKNYGGKGVGGKRVDPRRNLLVATLLLATLFTTIIVLVATNKA
ncbi:MAG: hypothetical protein JO091_14810 [Acidobacteriaceae bacterium]|nr:hypothetical protein [Acidobacteriaceae bacterium]